MHAEKCPICGGTGEYWPEGWCASRGDTCYGCGGKGWISVQDESYGLHWTIRPPFPSYGNPNGDDLNAPQTTWGGNAGEVN